MKTSPFACIKMFELRTDLFTKVVVEVSAKSSGRFNPRYAAFREYRAHDGTIRRTPYLGEREMKLVPGLLKQAADHVDVLKRERMSTPAPKGETPIVEAESEIRSEGSLEAA